MEEKIYQYFRESYNFLCFLQMKVKNDKTDP